MIHRFTYAHALFLEEGRVDYLHYGLFTENHKNIAEAQQLSTDLILERLPEPPCKVLEIGAGLGTIYHILVDRGYRVDGFRDQGEENLLDFGRRHRPVL